MHPGHDLLHWAILITIWFDVDLEASSRAIDYRRVMARGWVIFRIVPNAEIADARWRRRYGVVLCGVAIRWLSDRYPLTLALLLCVSWMP